MPSFGICCCGGCPNRFISAVKQYNLFFRRLDCLSYDFFGTGGPIDGGAPVFEDPNQHDQRRWKGKRIKVYRDDVLFYTGKLSVTINGSVSYEETGDRDDVIEIVGPNPIYPFGDGAVLEPEFASIEFSFFGPEEQTIRVEVSLEDRYAYDDLSSDLWGLVGTVGEDDFPPGTTECHVSYNDIDELANFKYLVWPTTGGSASYFPDPGGPANPPEISTTFIEATCSGSSFAGYETVYNQFGTPDAIKAYKCILRTARPTYNRHRIHYLDSRNPSSSTILEDSNTVLDVPGDHKIEAPFPIVPVDWPDDWSYTLFIDEITIL